MKLANDRQQDTLLQTFYTLIIMVLMIVRTGLDLRSGLCAPNYFLFLPPQEDAVMRDDWLSSLPPIELSQTEQFDRLYAAALTLLTAAEVVARQLAGARREDFEMMKLADMLAQSLRGQAGKTADQCARPKIYLDSS